MCNTKDNQDGYSLRLADEQFFPIFNKLVSSNETLWRHISSRIIQLARLKYNNCNIVGETYTMRRKSDMESDAVEICLGGPEKESDTKKKVHLMKWFFKKKT